MSITFKAFTTMVAEGKRAYSSHDYWKDDAEEAGFKVKKLSGELSKGNQTWGAFNEKDVKVGEFTEEEEGRGGWLTESQLTEIFGLFRNNEKAEKLKADREKLKADTADKVRKHRETQEEKRKRKEEEEEKDKEEREDKNKKRSTSTNATRSTRSAAGGRAAERDWVNNRDDD